MALFNAAAAMTRDPRTYRRREFQMLFLGRQRARRWRRSGSRAGTRSLFAERGRLQKRSSLQV
jgi:hypothetical protein